LRAAKAPWWLPVSAGGLALQGGHALPSASMNFPDTFTRHDLGSLPVAERAVLGRELGLPHFLAFQESIARCGAIRPGGLVRQYLLDLMLEGGFSIHSPMTGRLLRSGASVLLVDKSVLFAFPDQPEIMLGIGDVSQGYPICALVVVSKALFLPLSDSQWGFSERHLVWAAEAIRDTGWQIAPARGALTLVTGDTNFAHVAWNQFSAFEDLLQFELPADIKVIATQQPLAPIHDIFAELPPWPVVTLPDTSLQAQNRIGACFAPVGASLITTALANRIRRFAQQNMSDAARALDAKLAASGPVLWMSVRTRNRTATNQHDLLLRLGRRYLDAVSTGVVLIDGYSRQNDLDCYPDYQRNEAAEVLRQDEEAATALRAALDQHAPGRVLTAVGLLVGDSIALARHARLYFCHHGTVQHKVGWFNATPGVVHCNRAILQQCPAAWVAAQSAVALPPIYLAPDLVEDTPTDAGVYGAFSTLLRIDNYVVTDIEAAVDAVMDLARSLGLFPKDQPRHHWRGWIRSLRRAGPVARCMAWVSGVR
jgi:hypothetical protein